MLPALRKLLPLTAVLAARRPVASGPATPRLRQRTAARSFAQRRADGVVVRERGVGGYSLTLRDVWGPAKMPPAPKDFGPHFDFPPEPSERRTHARSLPELSNLASSDLGENASHMGLALGLFAPLE